MGSNGAWGNGYCDTPKSTRSSNLTSRLTVPGLWWLKRLPKLRRDLRWQIWTQWWTRGASASQHRWVLRSARPMCHCKRPWCTARKESKPFKHTFILWKGGYWNISCRLSESWKSALQNSSRLYTQHGICKVLTDHVSMNQSTVCS